MCGSNMTGYVQWEIDIDLAKMVWEILEDLDRMTTPPKALAIRLPRNEEGKYTLDVSKYKPGEEKDDPTVEAVLEVEPIEDGGYGDLDPELRRAMKFMYFYQSIYSHTQKYELGM